MRGWPRPRSHKRPGAGSKDPQQPRGRQPEKHGVPLQRRPGTDLEPLDPGDYDQLLEQAGSLLQQGREADAIPMLRRLARAGDFEIACSLGREYLSHDDYDTAEEILAPAAARGWPLALYLMGAVSRGRDQDESTARVWFRGGAAQGNPACMFEVGTAAMNDGAFETARFWLGRAAAAGDTNAMVNYGSLTGVNHDREGQILWYQRAADGGNEAARSALATLREDGEA